MILDIAAEVMKRRKHEGHEGGLEGCPLCSKTAPPSPEEDSAALDTALESIEAPLDPVKARIKSIMGHE